MYLWRKITPTQRADVLKARRLRRRPWHSPPHFAGTEHTDFHLSAACFEHAPLIGASLNRLEAFAAALLAAVEPACERLFAWCVLPNHYHLLLRTHNLRETTTMLGRFHGRTSFAWNAEDGARGRTCFHRTSDRAMRSEAHFWATMNYFHHNPVHHGLVEKWTDWPWSSAYDFLDSVGREEALRIWRQYPVLDYGKKWDAAGNPARRRKGASNSG
jgi:putative transposase